MGQKVRFDGKLYTEPTVQSRIVSGVSNFGSAASFGNIAIIDNGLGAGFGGGKGSHDGSNPRELSEFLNEFNSLAEMRDFVKGGVLWDLAKYLYNPSTNGRGATKVFLMRAAETTKGSIAFALDSTAVFAIDTKDEGLIANAVIETISTVDYLKKGYAIAIVAGEAVGTVRVQFRRGKWKGTDANSLEFSGIPLADAIATSELLTESVDITDISEFRAWAATDAVFNEYFEIGATMAASGAIGAADIDGIDQVNHQFAGATETYSDDAMTAVLDAIDELDNTFFLSLDDEDDADGADNVSILGHIVNNAEFKKFLVIGGGIDGTALTGTNSSTESAQNLNSPWAILCHGGFKVPYPIGEGAYYQKEPVYKAALVCGRLAGLEPQTPLTWKSINVQEELQTLTKAQRETAIDNGVLHTREVPQLGLVVNQGINTLQLNDNMINNDGTSPEISIMRIIAQLNKELTLFLRTSLFIGNNVGNVSASVIEVATNGFLETQQVVAGQRDGMIILYENVKAKRQGTTWYVTYDFQANTPINKIFTTGTIIDV